MMEPNNELAIGVFDSGVGGLTVVKELKKILPDESIVYFGDTARVPYGEKSDETILRYSIENAMFLMEKKIKLLVIACNTAAAYSADVLRQTLGIPVVSVIEPGAEFALQQSKEKKIGIIGTKATIRSQAYQKAILQKEPNACVIALPCPLFVPIVEEQFGHHLSSQLIAEEYLAPLKQASVDTLLLGCTHYPLLYSLISNVMGENVKVIDSASTCAYKVLEELKTHGLSAPKDAYTKHVFYVSDDIEKFNRTGSLFLGEELVSTLSMQHYHMAIS